MIKVLLTTFLLLFPIFSWGQSFKIKIVNVACDETSVCKRFEDKLSSLKNVDLNPRKLREKIRPFLFDLSIATFSYQVIKTDIGTVLKVKTTSRKIINSISFEMNPRSIDLGGLKNLLPYYEGEYHNPDLDAEAEAKVSKFLLEAGVANPKISIETPVKDGIVNIKFTINFERTLEIKKVKIKYDGKGNIAHIKNALNDLKNTTYNKKEINILMGDISKNLFETGYFFSELKLAPIKYLDGGEGLELEFILNLDVRVNVSFWGNKIFDRKRLMNLIKNYIRNQGLRLDGEDIIIAIEELYKEKGYYNNEVSFYIRSGKTKSGEIVDTYFFNIKEGKKIKITALNFQGNRLIADDTLIDLYEDKGTTLASSYFLDENFLEEFKKIMRAKYLEQGFVASSISKPNIEINEKTNTATVIYRIKESLICDLMRINYLRPIKDDLKLEIAKRLHNKKGKPFNILKLEDEIKSIIEVAQENGYFFAKILNKEDRSLLKFSKDYKEVEINVDLDLGAKSYFNSLQISGNTLSKERVITRESLFKKGEILKFRLVENFKGVITTLGIFKSVKVTPIVESTWKEDGESKQNIDLLIEVKERDSITLAVGPGFRTDAGAKLSSRLRFLNLGGMNRRVNLTAYANYRITLQTLDSLRREEGLRFLEYRFRVDFEEPYFFHLPLEFDISATLSRNRYFSFDADILTGSLAFSKNFSKVLSGSLKYQYDNINQYNASNIKDDGAFRVGAITPSIDLDFRDNPKIPRKGSAYTLSAEFATPGLGSINIEEFEVNYLKILSRNKWYFKLAHNWDIASSLVFGWEKNFADEILLDENGDPKESNGQILTKGYIPSIKVFRSEGIDIVRGFQETEINRLSNTGEDILDYFVNDTAYMFVFKLEARNYLGDSFVVAPFLDAGRVFVNKFRLLDLRGSVGLSFKLLTPVGSLDLDFGIKLDRETYPDGERDSFGRLHLLIGSF